MDIKRSSPDVGYFAPDLYQQMNFAQTVRVGNFVHFSGVVAANPAAECVAPGDFGAQLNAILEIYRKLLAKEGMTFANLVSVTIFTTDMAALVTNAPAFKLAFGDTPPASTWIEVKGLVSPDFLLEVVVIAAD